MEVSWTEIKAFVTQRAVSIQWIEMNNRYWLKAFDGPFELEATISKSSSASDDQTDFETNFKSTGNEILEPTDYDNSPQVRIKMAKLGAKYLGDCFDLTTASMGSLYHKDASGNNTGYSVAKFYDADNAEVTDPANNSQIVKTVVDWEPPFDYEVIGGAAWCEEKPTTDVRCWALAAPDIPAQYGGSIEFLRGLNFNCIEEQQFFHDGRVAKQMRYDANTHQGKFRFIFRHDAGVQLHILIEMEIFR